MLTGINFSPPLYFFFNFCLQLIFQTSIENLRIQSLIFIILGCSLSFLLTRKIFGTTVAFFATILVTSQSSLLLSQAQEARHYAMFFACGAWVLYMQNLCNVAAKKYTWLTFLAHFGLCQVHYLGIIFSLLSGSAYFLTSNNTNWCKRIPWSIALCWLVSFASYLFYLNSQKSILNTWAKPNKISDLLAGYNDSFMILTILFPILAIILTNKLNGDTKTYSIKETYFPKPIIVTSVLWFSVPFVFWVISHLSSLNLFVDRYFIPKESALILLVAYGIRLILQKLPKIKLMSIPILVIFLLSIVAILISSKRAAFGLNKDTNYHHSLIIEKSYPKTKQPITIEGDPKYFPNAYLGRNECLFAMKNKSLIEVYKRFSTKIRFLD